MKVASVADVKARFSAYVKATEEGPVIVTRNGRPVSIMLPVRDDEELERLLLASSPRFQAFLEAADQRISEGKGIPHERFWRELEEKNRVKVKGAKARGKSARAD